MMFKDQLKQLIRPTEDLLSDERVNRESPENGDHTGKRIHDWLRCPQCGNEDVSFASNLNGLGYIESTVWCNNCNADVCQRTGESAHTRWGSSR